MKWQKFLLGFAAVLALVLGGWSGWHWFTTPAIPHLALEGASPKMAEEADRALDPVRRSPRSGKAWGELALFLIANGFYAEALPCLVQAERFAPTEPRWPYLHGTLLRNTTPHDGTARLRRALTLARSDDEKGAILFSLGLALVQEGRLDEAEECLRALEKTGADRPRIQFGLGLLALARGDRPQARHYLSQLIDSPFARKKACSLLAGLMEDNQQPTLDYRRKAADLPDDLRWPDHFTADIPTYQVDPTRRLTTYRELKAQGRPGEALKYLVQLVTDEPDEMTCFILGYDLLAMHQFEQAEQALRQALTFNPHNPKTHLFIGAALFERGEKALRQPDGKEQANELFRQAVQAEDTALKIQWNLTDAHLIRGRALSRLGRRGEAIRSLREATLVSPNLAEAHQTLGEALADSGQFREAIEHLENAVRVAPPGDPRPRQALEKCRAKAKSAP